MSRKTSSSFPPEYLERRTNLRNLLKYLASRVSVPVQGLHSVKHYSVLYYPDYRYAAERSTAAVESFWPRKTQQEARQRAGVPSSGPAYITWHAKALQRHVERLAGSLVVPIDPQTGSGDAWTLYRSQIAGFHPADPALVSHVYRAELTAPVNYTVLRRTYYRPETLDRILTPPLPFAQFLDQEPHLSPTVAALYRAWHTLHSRGQPSSDFDAASVGLEWTDDGLIFVNWARFLTSPFAPPQPLDPISLVQDTRGGQTHGRVYRWKTSAFPDPTPHTPFLLRARLITPEEAEDEQLYLTCSLFDPLYLADHPEFLSAEHHARRVARVAARTQATTLKRAKRAAARRDGENVIPERTPKVYARYYTPFEHVPAQFASHAHLCHFPPTQREVVYAIEYRRQYFFRPPSLYPITASSPTCETAAWRRALDTFQIVENFTQTGEIGAVTPKSHHALCDEATRAELTQAAAECIADFVSYDALSREELRQARRFAKQRYGYDPDSAAPASRWYLDKIKSVAKRRLPVAAVCRTATVLLPSLDGANNILYLNPELLGHRGGSHVRTSTRSLVTCKFFSLLAIKHIQQVAEDAPYLYAWASFCRKLIAQGPGALEEVTSPADVLRWTPQDDLTLLLGYSALPRMSSEAKAALLTQLDRFNWDAVVRRVAELNRLLAQVFTASQMEKYTIGKLHSRDERTCRRLLLVIGLALGERRRGRHSQGLRRHMPSISRALHLSDAAIDELVIPVKYQLNMFEQRIKVARTA